MKKILFTPGPLSTSKTVKEAMLEDMGSRDHVFVNAVKDIRNGLLKLAHVSREEHHFQKLFFKNARRERKKRWMESSLTPRRAKEKSSDSQVPISKLKFEISNCRSQLFLHEPHAARILPPAERM